MSEERLGYRGRIAPSPTGLLHVGHAATFWTACERARQAGGTLVFRNEDLDPYRSRPEFVDAMFEDLRWLGITWQEGPDVGGAFGPYEQSRRRELYLQAWKKLLQAGAIYPCTCSRKDLHAAAGAPHEGAGEDDEPMYSGKCRNLGAAVDVMGPAGVNWRFRVPDGERVSFQDGAAGSTTFVAGRDFGDFVVWRRDDVPAYQLACVVDDEGMRITEVVRGADLLKSTARQILVARALGYGSPAWFHCPLVRDAAGQRLAKRHDALSLRALRQQGWTAEQVLRPAGEVLESSSLRAATLLNVADSFAQSVKEQADIVRVIGEYVRLQKAGAQNFRGLCPFHKEKTPSFNVHATQQFFHCFGCSTSGDVFTFVQKMEGQSFPEAVRTVAQKCGIPLPKREFSSPEEAREARVRGRLLELNEQACAWFQEQLKSPEAAGAREYLSRRGVSAAAIAKFRIGYAPDSFNALREKLQAGADVEALRDSGLFSSKQGEDGSSGPLYSRFRKRITFPIMNEGGRVIAFTARALEAGEKVGPKYINSPETPLYTKGNVLFNLDKAKSAIRELKFALLVEGQMDCISVYMAGIHNVIATSGTAFTEAQVRMLARFTQQVVVNFDPDTAGANAAEKSIAMLTEEGFTIKVVTLEGGLDPDRYVRDRGIEAYAAALRAAKSQPDYLIDRARTLFPAQTADAKVKALNWLLPHIRQIPNRVARDEFAANAAHRLGVDSALMRQELKQAAIGRRDSLPGSARGGTGTAISEAERVLLRALALPAGDPARKLVAQHFGKDPALFQNLTCHASVKAMVGGADAGKLMSAEGDPGERALLASALLSHGDPISEELVAETVRALKRGRLEARQRELRGLLAEASRGGRADEVERLSREKIEVDRLLRAP